MLFKNDWTRDPIGVFKKTSTVSYKSSMRFHSAMATLEPQKYVIAGTVGTENILLVSGRLVLQDCQSSKVSSIRVGYKNSKSIDTHI